MVATNIGNKTQQKHKLGNTKPFLNGTPSGGVGAREPIRLRDVFDIRDEDCGGGWGSRKVLTIC